MKENARAVVWETAERACAQSYNVLRIANKQIEAQRNTKIEFTLYAEIDREPICAR